MKTRFELEDVSIINIKGSATIIGERPLNKPYVHINIEGTSMFIKDKDLERFAVNILKALKSRKLK